MNARFKSLGFGSKRKSSGTSITTYNNPSDSPAGSTNLAQQTSHSSSNTSLAMNNPPGLLGRPPSYTYPNAVRSGSPMAPSGHPSYAQHPALDTSQRYGSNPQMSPPQPPLYNTGYGHPQSTIAPYGRGPAEVDAAGAGSKAQLIVGIDFVCYIALFFEDLSLHTS